MSALNELRELDASLEGEEDIGNNGGPNTAMRVRQVLAEVIPAVAELIDEAEEFLRVVDDYPENPVPINRRSATVRALRAALAKAQQP